MTIVYNNMRYRGYVSKDLNSIIIRRHDLIIQHTIGKVFFSQCRRVRPRL